MCNEYASPVMTWEGAYVHRARETIHMLLFRVDNIELTKTNIHHLIFIGIDAWGVRLYKQEPRKANHF